VRRIKIFSPVIHLSQMTAARLEALGKLILQKLIRTWIAPFESIKNTNKICTVAQLTVQEVLLRKFYDLFTIFHDTNYIRDQIQFTWNA